MKEIHQNLPKSKLFFPAKYEWNDNNSPEAFIFRRSLSFFRRKWCLQGDVFSLGWRRVVPPWKSVGKSYTWTGVSSGDGLSDTRLELHHHSIHFQKPLQRCLNIIFPSKEILSQLKRTNRMAHVSRFVVYKMFRSLAVNKETPTGFRHQDEKPKAQTLSNRAF